MEERRGMSYKLVLQVGLLKIHRKIEMAQCRVQLRNDGKTSYNTILSYDRWLSLGKHRGKRTWVNGTKWMGFQSFGILNKYRSTWLKSLFCLKINRKTRRPEKRIPTWTLQKLERAQLQQEKSISLRVNKLSLIVYMFVEFIWQSYFLFIFVNADHLLIEIELKSMENKTIRAYFS